MQTFLPVASYTETARILDFRRLGKQRVEAKQILLILMGETHNSSWATHPAVRMWRNYEWSLSAYGLTICEEWIKRGYNDNLAATFRFYHETITTRILKKFPEAFYASHRAALLAKDYSYYSKFGWTEKPGIKYIWPE